MTHNKHRRYILLIAILILSFLSISNSVSADDSQTEPTDKTNIDLSSVSLDNGNHINTSVGSSDTQKYQNQDFTLKVHFENNSKYSIMGISYRSIEISDPNGNLVYNPKYSYNKYCDIISSKKSGTYTITFKDRGDVNPRAPYINIYQVQKPNITIIGKLQQNKPWYQDKNSVAYTILQKPIN